MFIVARDGGVVEYELGFDICMHWNKESGMIGCLKRSGFIVSFAVELYGKR